MSIVCFRLISPPSVASLVTKRSHPHPISLHHASPSLPPQALLSTHPYIAAPFFAAVLDSYFNSLPNPKDAAAMKTKFEAVRMRGRKRLAFG